VKVLIVDDDAKKLRGIISALKAGGATDDMITIARDSRAAKVATQGTPFDLMILDLVLPSHPEKKPENDGGVKLLKEIRDRERFKTPREVIGLTAFETVKDDAIELFAEDMWSIVSYEVGSLAWSEQLTRKISHLLLAERAEAPLGYECKVCVITALAFELEAVTRLPWKWRECDRPSDVTLYMEGHVSTRSGDGVVFAATANRMGMTATAALAAKMIEAFRPEFMIMVGIAAGVQGRVNLGDVIVADPTWDWGSGKYLAETSGPEFEAAPHQLALNAVLRLKVDRLVKRKDLFNDIRLKWPAERPNTPLDVVVGPVASGAAVLADPEKIALIERQHRKLLGIEMEAYGLYLAAMSARVPQPLAVCFKSVCDFADQGKNDSMQPYAAYCSTEVMRVFVEKII
jgi:nucleoside phosphorylase